MATGAATLPLPHAVRVVASGDALAAPAITRQLLEQFVSRPRPGARTPKALQALTAREVEVLQHVARGLATTEVAAALHLSEATVKTHMTRLMAKLGLRDQAGGGRDVRERADPTGAVGDLTSGSPQAQADGRRAVPPAAAPCRSSPRPTWRNSVDQSPDPCCSACAARGEPFDPQKKIRDSMARSGFTVVSVDSENPHDVGFSYTIGRESLGQPELITFSLDASARSAVLAATASRVAGRRRWDKRFITSPGPRKRVQLLPVAKQWRDVYALFALDYWDDDPFRLWQVRLPGADGQFSRDGVCCTPPCQPLLDGDDPWPPIEHDVGALSTDVLWHRVVDEGGVWGGRWEQLGSLRLGKDRFVVRNVPFLADDVCMSDVVRAPAESSGRRVIHSVVQESVYRTVRIECEADDEPGRRRVDKALTKLAEHDEVVWECSHWRRRHWTIAVARSRVASVEDLLRPLLRDGLAAYQVVERTAR